MNFRNYLKKYAKKKLSSIISDVLLVALIVIMLVPKWRREFGSVVVRLTMTSPNIELLPKKKLNNNDLSFTFYDKQGYFYKLEDMLNQPVFITYWATWCHHCIAELPELDKLNRKTGNQIKIIILINEDFDVAESYILSKGYELPLYKQQSFPSELLQSDKIPASFLINRHSELVLRKNGTFKWGSDKFIEFVNNL